MEQKIILFLFLKISKFLLLTWICRFENDMSPLNKNLDEKCCLHRKLNTTNYRLLGKYVEDKDSIILVLILPILDLSLEKFIDGGLLALLELLSRAEAKGDSVESGVQGSLIILLIQSK
ncbi:fam-l protein [Plasmodium brasilianum]|uniref:Fam-l protein n=1 Tax=Plasmodium brasilianum TaxID=5824 RepID=A0ACB9YCF6_PLABR|nr:fam-l protein [Plasmodium brasilianum]